MKIKVIPSEEIIDGTVNSAYMEKEPIESNYMEIPVGTPHEPCTCSRPLI